MHHHKTAVRRSLQRRAEVESMKGDLAETERFVTRSYIAELAEIRQPVAGVGVTTLDRCAWCT